MRSQEMLLHIGAPKCGSSALQTALSQQPVIQPNDPSAPTYVYWAYSGLSGLLEGRALQNVARNSPFGYANADGLGNPKGNARPIAALAAALQDIQHSATPGEIPILSAEPWIGHSGRFSKALNSIESPPSITAMAYVRPPATWANSAWWQWGAWIGSEQNEWLKGRSKPTSWASRLRNWPSVCAIKTVNAYMADRDIVAHFYERLGAPLPKRKPVNSTLSHDLLQFLLRNRAFRPSAHTAQVEFVLARHVSFSGPKPPFALNREVLQYILDNTAAENDALKEFLSADELARMENNADWWHLEAYEERLTQAENMPSDDPDRLIADLEASPLSRGFGQTRFMRKKIKPLEPSDPSAADQHIATLINRIRAADNFGRKINLF